LDVRRASERDVVQRGGALELVSFEGEKCEPAVRHGARRISPERLLEVVVRLVVLAERHVAETEPRENSRIGVVLLLGLLEGADRFAKAAVRGERLAAEAMGASVVGPAGDDLAHDAMDLDAILRRVLLVERAHRTAEFVEPRELVVAAQGNRFGDEAVALLGSSAV